MSITQPSILAVARAELADREAGGCEEGGRHKPTRNEHRDAWCSKCGERLILPGSAGWTPDYIPGKS